MSQPPGQVPNFYIAVKSTNCNGKSKAQKKCNPNGNISPNVAKIKINTCKANIYLSDSIYPRNNTSPKNPKIPKSSRLIAASGRDLISSAPTSPVNSATLIFIYKARCLFSSPSASAKALVQSPFCCSPSF